MTKPAQEILEQALALGDEERIELAERLFETATISTDPEYLAAWQTEIRERIRQIETGEETPIPWREALDQVIRGEVDVE